MRLLVLLILLVLLVLFAFAFYRQTRDVEMKVASGRGGAHGNRIVRIDMDWSIGVSRAEIRWMRDRSR